MWLLLFILGFLGGYFFPTDVKASLKAYFEVSKVEIDGYIMKKYPAEIIENKNLVKPQEQIYNGTCMTLATAIRNISNR